jgi:RNA polymerase sigma-70 factor (ECF subfamily)
VGAGRDAPGSDERTGEDASDEDLASRFVAGEPGAFDELVRRHRDRIYRFVCWHLGAPGADAHREAEDVTQDVLVEVFRSLPRYEGRSRLRTWMLGIAHNLCRHSRRGPSGARGALVLAGAADEALRAVPDATADLDALLARREVQARVRSAIESLGPEHRDVVLLRELEGLSYGEIAGVLRVPLGTVRSRLHNARVELAACLLARAGASGEDR